MLRGFPTIILVLLFCALAMSGCVDLPFVVATGPYFPVGDPGVALDGLDHGFWVTEQKEQLRFEPDKGTNQPGDYLLTFTHNALPEPLPTGDNGPVLRDPGNPENNEKLQAHLFDIDGQLYLDISTLQTLAEPMPDVPISRATGSEGHILCRFTGGLGQFSLDFIDVDWWTGMAPVLSADVKITYPEPLPDKPTVPVMRDTPERLTAFVKKYAKELTWSHSMLFKRG
jgi:hypothetical protein